jgi:uncharacterized protein with PIN domain
MKFAADCMLGTLAKWLMILGHDVAYHRKIDDGDLVALARREERTILTSDRRLVKRKAVKDYILITGSDLTEQIRQVLKERRLPIRRDRLFRRCLVCNQQTDVVPRETVREKVPVYVYRTQERFTRCPQCARVYWRATHVSRMLETLGSRLTSVRPRGYHPGLGKGRARGS